MRIRLLLLGALAVTAGCAPSRPGLPGVPPTALPDAWTTELARESSPHPLSAGVRWQITTPGRPRAELDGKLELDPGRALLLSASYGVFRPIFALRATADSVQLLVHERRVYSTAGRRVEDLGVNPAALLVQAVDWVLAPEQLWRRFQPRDGGTFDGPLWIVSGRVDEALDLELSVDPKRRLLAGVRVLSEGERVVEAKVLRAGRVGDALLPRRILVELPASETTLEVELVGLEARESLAPPELVRPAGWRRVPPALLLQPGFGLPPPE